MFVLAALIGTFGITLLPVSLELAAELTRAPDASSAFLWAVCNIFTIIMILGTSPFPVAEVYDATIADIAFRQLSLL